MTTVSSSVKRLTIADKEGGLSPRRRGLVIMVGPGNHIGIREVRGREIYWISARELFDLLEYRAAKEKVRKVS